MAPPPMKDSGSAISRITGGSLGGGADIKGCITVLTDNFEWQHGYGKRFGLIHIDYNPETRTEGERPLVARSSAITASQKASPQLLR